MNRLSFRIDAQASRSAARATSFKTLHSEVQTPIFMPVGTQATVKGLKFYELEAAGSNILLANTYHLLLRPGAEVFERLGGIHRFMNWNRSVLTDSGGFQIFSLPNSRVMTEEGAEFRSYVDGIKVFLSPERSIAMQRSIGSDIMMVLDQCIPSTTDHETARLAMELTHRWAKRSLLARGESEQSLFGIVQGACFEDLRRQSAEVITDMAFDGFAIGGLAVGETKSQREDFTELTASLLPADRPRYLMGVGTPIDLLEAVHRGVDMFDCIIPTAHAQQGNAFTSQGQIRLTRSVYKFAEEALDANCPCPCCQSYSKAYLHHLFKSDENLGTQLVSYHNISFYHRLMAEMRKHIIGDTFYSYYLDQRNKLVEKDAEHPSVHPQKKRRQNAKPRELGAYKIVVSDQAYASICHKQSGEIMHSVSNPDQEAWHLYADQSRLADRIRSSENSPLVVWDVGLGAAHNAMAAIKLYETEQERDDANLRVLKIISFENDLDALRLALTHPQWFKHLRHAAPHQLLSEGSWVSGNGKIIWEVHSGDFHQTMLNADPAHIIFYDPFSAKTNTEFWSVAAFKALAAASHNMEMELFTYSSSTAIRAGLLAAGFFVAKGRGTGPKADTTIALAPRLAATNPFQREFLDESWLARWQRSHQKTPYDIQDEGLEDFKSRIVEHPQFKSDVSQY